MKLTIKYQKVINKITTLELSNNLMRKELNSIKEVNKNCIDED